VLKAMKDLIKRMEALIASLDHEFLMYSASKARGKSYPSPLTQAMGLWEEASNLSQIIKPDFGKPLSDWLKVREEPSAPSGVFAKKYIWNHEPRDEALRVPMAPILLCLSETLGVEVPDLPHQPRVGTKGKAWFNRLKLAKATFVANEQVVQALHRRLNPFIRSIKWIVGTGGRREIPLGF